jgi:hypothetical protein
MATLPIRSKISTVVCSIHHSPCCMERDGGRSRRRSFRCFRQTATQTRKTGTSLQNTLREAMHEMCWRSSKVPFPTTATCECASFTFCFTEHVFTPSGYPLVVMVEPSQDRNCHHLFPCIMRGTRGSTRFRNLLLSPLMGSCPIEVGYILIEYTVELLLVEDQ